MNILIHKKECLENLDLNYKIFEIETLFQKIWSIRNCWESVSHVWLLDTPWTVAHQASLSTGMLQTRILEMFAMSSFGGSSQPRDHIQLSHTADGFFTVWAAREAQENWSG